MARTPMMRIPKGGNRFSEVPSVSVPRSTFNRSHHHKTTFDLGFLYPILVEEVLPGDTFSVSPTAFVRLNTPVFPIMDNIYLDWHFFFVPNRLVWRNWQRFMGEQDNPGDTTDYLIPQIFGTPLEGSVFDYMGLPTQTPNPITFSALPYRAYELIWDNWYRDQNLQDSVFDGDGDGPDALPGLGLRPRGKRHDYFTSGLPWPQKPYGAFDTGVTLPLGDRANIYSGAPDNTDLGIYSSAQSDSLVKMSANSAQVQMTNIVAEPGAELYADLTGATSASINSIRQAFQIQKMLERDARGGTRYTEILKSHFGVTSPDARLQRPEFLGGGSQAINITPIAQTIRNTGAADPDDAAALGTLGAVGTSVVRSGGFSQSFTEHGHIIGLISARHDMTYQQGLPRMYSRRDRFDFYFPSLAHLGEQATLVKEIYADGSEADDLVFNYQERHAEYRYAPSRVSGKFRSNASGSLDSWHLAYDFESRPVFNQVFIREDENPLKRALTFQNEPDFIADIRLDIKAARPMPVYGVPGLVDHF